MNREIATMMVMEEHGDSVINSLFFRAFCCGCGTPMRVKKSELDIRHWCETCDPKHIGCSSPPSPIDRDDYGVSTQNAYEGAPII